MIFFCSPALNPIVLVTQDNNLQHHQILDNEPVFVMVVNLSQ